MLPRVAPGMLVSARAQVRTRPREAALTPGGENPHPRTVLAAPGGPGSLDLGPEDEPVSPGRSEATLRGTTLSDYPPGPSNTSRRPLVTAFGLP